MSAGPAFDDDISCAAFNATGSVLVVCHGQHYTLLDGTSLETLFSSSLFFEPHFVAVVTRVAHHDGDLSGHVVFFTGGPGVFSVAIANDGEASASTVLGSVEAFGPVAVTNTGLVSVRMDGTVYTLPHRMGRLVDTLLTATETHGGDDTGPTETWTRAMVRSKRADVRNEIPMPSSLRAASVTSFSVSYWDGMIIRADGAALETEDLREAAPRGPTSVLAPPPLLVDWGGVECVSFDPVVWGGGRVVYRAEGPIQGMAVVGVSLVVWTRAGGAVVLDKA